MEPKKPNQIKSQRIITWSFVVNLQEKDDLGTYWSMSCES